MTMSSRKCSGNAFHPASGNGATGAARTTRTSLLLLLIVISVTVADRYDQPPALASVAGASGSVRSNSLTLKDGIGNDVSTGSLRTSSILPAVSPPAGAPNPLVGVKHHHRFGKPIAATAASGKVTAGKGSKKRLAVAAKLSSQQVPELQVGCADGFIRADPHHRLTSSGFEKKWERKRSRSRRYKRDADPVEGERKRRGYYQWASKTVVQPQPHIPPQAAYSVWQPSFQQLTRPYFIPMWGNAGRNPVYFPPQPLNPPFPLDNPRTSYLPSMPYLPPYPPRDHTNSGTITTTTTLRPIWEGGDEGMDGMDGDGDDGMDGDGDDGMVDVADITEGGSRFDVNRPVWDSSSGSSNSGNSINRIPTRRPKVSGTTTPVPSILHGTSANTGNSGGTSNGNGFNNNMPPLASDSTVNQLRPNQIGGSSQQQPNNQFTTRRPPQRTTITTTTTTTRRPTINSNNDNNISKGPSRCVWAIVSCCTASNGQVNFSCFEELGCEGPFWDTNPCDSEVAKAAIANALKFYGS